jgi:hypothetical protein
MRAVSGFLSALLLAGCVGKPAAYADRTAQTAVLVTGETLVGGAKGCAVGAVGLGALFCPMATSHTCVPAIVAGGALGALIGSAQGFDRGVQRAREVWQHPWQGSISGAYR